MFGDNFLLKEAKDDIIYQENKNKEGGAMLYIYILLAGLGGGLLRGLVGYTKYKVSYKDVKFEPKYFLFLVLVAGAVGVITAAVVKESGLLPTIANPAVAFIVGYAGGDFIENLYKIIGKKPILYNTSS